MLPEPGERISLMGYDGDVLLSGIVLGGDSALIVKWDGILEPKVLREASYWWETGRIRPE